MIQLQVDCMARHASLDIEIYREDVQKAAADIGGAFGVMNLIRFVSLVDLIFIFFCSFF